MPWALAAAAPGSAAAAAAGLIPLADRGLRTNGAQGEKSSGFGARRGIMAHLLLDLESHVLEETSQKAALSQLRHLSLRHHPVHCHDEQARRPHKEYQPVQVLRTTHLLSLRLLLSYHLDQLQIPTEHHPYELTGAQLTLQYIKQPPRMAFYQ